VDGDCVAKAHQTLGAGQSRRPGPHHSYALRCRTGRRIGAPVGTRGRDLIWVRRRPIRDESFEAHDADRTIRFPSRANVLADVIADAATDRGEWVVLSDRPVCIGETSLTNKCDIPLRALVDWARVPARGAPRLLDHVGIGYCLRVELEGRASL